MAIVNYRPISEEPITVKAKCGQPGCIYDARVRVYKNSGGYTDVCKPCYDKLFQAYAHNYCEQRGLKTRQDKIDFCKRMARSLNLKVAA